MQKRPDLCMRESDALGGGCLSGARAALGGPSQDPLLDHQYLQPHFTQNSILYCSSEMVEHRKRKRPLFSTSPPVITPEKDAHEQLQTQQCSAILAALYIYEQDDVPCSYNKLKQHFNNSDDLGRQGRSMVRPSFFELVVRNNEKMNKTTNGYLA
ncbi:uncharacterized protein BDR25DRAFT_360443 [Lindgomyces ingoldianus]|uniref:Uncharacterized protein n=1 Tax=Lindgomyces ingoldianus TaxID=673940 RepID=A0ACB6QH60_9PLEO|nr:uncharacterized protein BDR25DRAFT_360443 [Lindgomyces ingoldianus]KAF2465486.1 hypothetical protein BDR25DRAFT_360443 [Lindgomyces ingoldianus]